MTNESIATAIANFTQHVRESAGSTGWDFGHFPTHDERAERRAGIEAICDEMDALAHEADSRFSEFEMLRHKMGSNFPPTPLDHLMAVTAAFGAAGRLDAK